MKELIRIRDMYKIYNPGEDEVRALDGVSLTICEGEFVAIIGHSGSGKSTLMNMLGCLDIPTAGKYYLDGKDVLSMTDNELSEIRNRTIGFIFQGFNLIQNLDAIGNVELPLIYRGIDRKTRRLVSKKALCMVGLEKRMKHRPSQMSGGQQQRVAVARAIAARPPVILADEPTGNLDPKNSFEIMKLLEEINERGTTVLVVTHNREIVNAFKKRVITMKKGVIVSDEQEGEYLNEN